MNPSFVFGWTFRLVGKISNVGEKTANKEQTMPEDISKPRSIQKQFKINHTFVLAIKYILNR